MMLDAGFYEWDGEACRVVVDATRLGGKRAERYIASEGFVEMNPVELFLEASLISEAEFDALTTRMTSARGEHAAR